MGYSGWILSGLTTYFTDLIFEFEDTTVFGCSGDALLWRPSDLEFGRCFYGFTGCPECLGGEALAVGPMTALVLGNLVGEEAGVASGLWATLLWAGSFSTSLKLW